jgi:hypothetical protein
MYVWTGNTFVHYIQKQILKAVLEMFVYKQIVFSLQIVMLRIVNILKQNVYAKRSEV